MDSTMKREVPLFLALAFAAAAQVRFEVPSLGYVHDREAKSLRLVTGVAGAAALERSVDTGGGAIERAWISPRGFALTQGKLDAGVRYFDWTRGVQRDLSDSVEAAAISPNGRFFAILSGGTAEIWDGDGPSRTHRFEAAGARAIAVSDDGAAALLVTASGVSMWQREGLQQIWSGDAIRGADFLPNSRDFAAFDGGRNKVLTMRSGSMTEIDAKSNGVHAFALSGDGRTVTLGGDKTIELIDTVSGTSSILATESSIDSISRAGANGAVMQLRFRDDARTALLEWAGLDAPQIEFLVLGSPVVNGGAQ
jgi:WD40 repeat protein